MSFLKTACFCKSCHEARAIGPVRRIWSCQTSSPVDNRWRANHKQDDACACTAEGHGSRHAHNLQHVPGLWFVGAVDLQPTAAIMDDCTTIAFSDNHLEGIGTPSDSSAAELGEFTPVTMDRTVCQAFQQPALLHQGAGKNGVNMVPHQRASARMARRGRYAIYEQTGHQGGARCASRHAGPPLPSCPNKLACMGLVSHVIVPSRAIRREILP